MAKDAKGHGSDGKGGASGAVSLAKDAKGHGSDGRKVGGAMPLKGHPYHMKSDAELNYIARDAHAAAQAVRNSGMTTFDPEKNGYVSTEGKYLDQVNDASTVLGYRQRGGSQVQPAPAAHAEGVGSVGAGRISPVDGQYFKPAGPDQHHSDYSEFGVHGRYGALNRGS